jgi:hypothetical protein
MRKKFTELLPMLLVAMVVSSLTGRTANAGYPVIQLDINNRNIAAETESGFTSFTIADSGSEVEGITIEFAGTLDSRRRGAPVGIEYEQIYRDFIFSRPGGMTITLSGLEVNKAYEITIYSYDTSSDAGGDRIADWTANGEFCLTSGFSAVVPPTGPDDYAFTGTAQSDDTGTIILECGPNENTTEESGANNPYGFINALVVSSLSPLTEARRPVPADGAMHPDIWVRLEWLPGANAASHDVYLGENFNEVNGGTGETYRGNQADAYLLAGFFSFPYPDGLVPGTTYYWRIDEVNDLHPDSPWKGNVWSFTVPTKTAFNPIPVDGSRFVDPNVTLIWTAGAGSTQHHVYFGDNLEDVQAGTGGTDKGVIEDPNYAPELLELDKTYYWRVDESDGTNTNVGDIWSFTTTLEGLGTVVMDMWENISGATLDLLRDDSRYPDNPNRSDVLTEFGTADTIGDSYGARIYGWLYVPLTGDYTFYFTSADQGELWLSTDDDPNNIELLASEPTWGQYDAFVRWSEPVPLIGGEKYYIEAVWKESTNWDHCRVAWQGAGIRNQEVIQGSYLSPYEPVNAFGPSPSDGRIDVRVDPVLRWKAGKNATSHELYLGTDKEAVLNAGIGSPEYIGTSDLGSESYESEKLEMETSYYWRVDEVNNLNPDSPWIGEIWSFTTGDFLVVDDFEDYNTDDYQIWFSWHDGLGAGTAGTPGYLPGNGSGSAVGDETTSSYTEETIVHGGSQAMPLAYDNNKQGFAFYSEVEHTLTDQRDWTAEGVAELSIWFRGYPANVGSFVEGPVGTYTITASGTDITGQSDEFHFAYKMLTGPGSIIARVVSVDNTDPWAKAGVMIRETLEPGSKHAIICVTPNNGVAFEGRIETNEDSFSTNQAEITAPHWVKLERDLGGNITAYHSVNGSSWVSVEGSISQSIQMSANVYVGLAVTSHNPDATCQAVFSNVSITGNVSQQQWMHQDIGIASNDAEPLYITVSNSTGEHAVVVHEDPSAATINTWTEWIIPLQALADQGIVLTNVDRIAIGLGTKGNMTEPGGSGKMYFDDIRLYRPRDSAAE